jgi:hypothetical protein
VRSDKDDPLNPYWNDMNNPLASQVTIANECKPPFLSGECECGDDGKPIPEKNSCATDRTPVCTHLDKDSGGYSCTCVGGLNASFASWTAATYSSGKDMVAWNCVGGQVIGSSDSAGTNHTADFCGLQNSKGYQPAGSAAQHYNVVQPGQPNDYCVNGTHYVESPDPSVAKFESGFCQFGGS